ncbi:hypothetical protein UlMin_032293 [Ulmus minor]
MPPGPFIAKDPRVVVLLDANSFPILFDNSKILKRNVFEGTYMASTSFSGGYRVCSQLDPSEPKHASLKNYFFSILASKHDKFIPLLRQSMSVLFSNLDQQISNKPEVELNALSDSESFNFVFSLFCGQHPSQTKSLGEKASSIADKWLVPQVSPIVTLGVPKILSVIEDLLLHTFPLPFFLIKSNYTKLYEAFYSSTSNNLLADAAKFGIEKEEACHNLIFLSCFNTYGGLKVLIPAIFKWVGRGGKSLHRQLADEIRTVVKQEGGVTFASLEKMSLTKSVAYEVLRIEPPVPFQYGNAKEDIVVESHDASFKIKKGEMVFGFQPFATRDPKVFDKAEDFVGDRFVGLGEKLLKYVFWSNGRESDKPTADNKQCPGRDLVVLVARVVLVEFFLRYDTFEVEDKLFLVGSKVTFKSLTKASSAV